MAYNTRRSNDATNLGGVRRQNPPLSNNFIPGGQLPPPNLRQPQQRQGQQQGPQGQGFQNNGTGPAPQQRPQQQQQQTQQQSAPQQQQSQQFVTTTVVQPLKAENNDEQPQLDESGNPIKKKPFWVTRAGGKISRKERQRRRNVRLSKILQPKNAVMILNELVRNCAYTINDMQPGSQWQYQASVLVEEQSHIGYGHSKMEAKNAAAESALKFIVKQRKLAPLPDAKQQPASDGEEKMDTSDASDIPDASLPWQHVASFALFKLLNSWGEDPFQARQGGAANNTNAQPESGLPPQNKPAKKMPENSAHMNPLMLLNQMLPQAQFEELGRTGNPPNVTFTFKVTVEGKTFSGSGSNKKAAKKAAAFDVCHHVLSVQYPPEIYTPSA